MKITAFLVFLFSLHLSAATIAQTVTLSEHKVPLEKVLNDIRRQSGYVFFYNQDWMQQSQPVDIEVKNLPLNEALKACFKNQPFDYAIVNKTIVLKLKEVTTEKKETPVPQITISGKVVDETGNPLSGVSVIIKATNYGVATDVDGKFSIPVPNNSYLVVFSYIGYETQELLAKEISRNAVITLKAAQNNLKEVEINKGYYTDRRELETGDVNMVTSKEIQEQPVGNPLAALEGRVPGLVISQTTGAPGGAFVVQIMGKNSLLNGNDPLYVIDGVPYSAQTVGIINSTLKGNTQLYGWSSTNTGGNPLNYINPSDIENIAVLKDADATSIYGSRGANGVILITTKKGKAGATRVDANVYSGIGNVTRMADLMNTQQYLQMRHEAFKNDGASPDPTYDFDLTFWDTTRNTNWQKALIGNTAQYNDAQVSVSGGNDNTQYLIGGGYHRETTVFSKNEADQKGSVHVNINSSSADKKFKIAFTAGFTADRSNVVPTDQTFIAIVTPPDAPPLYNNDGSLNWAPLVAGQAGTWTNPLSYLLVGYQGSTNNLVSNAKVSYNLVQGLILSANLGYTNTQTNENIATPTTSQDPGYGIYRASAFNATNSGSWIIEPQINYSRNIGKGRLSALMGSTFQDQTLNGQGLLASGFSADNLLQDIQAATTVSVQSALNSDYKYNAIYSRLNYNWEDKYLVNLTARRDGSSRFGPGKQFANFGSAGIAWLFANEKFVQRLFPFLSSGKLRGSYGTSGNDQVGDYRYLDLYKSTQYPYGGTQGLYPSSLFNPNLAWEQDKKWEGGLTLGILKDRIVLDATYYVSRSNNQLVSTPLSSVTGFSSVPSNLPATVQNAAIELELHTVNMATGNFRWSSSFNLTVPRNKLVSFPGLATSSYASQFVVGQPITIKKVYRFNGVNDTTGVYQFLNAQGQNTYNPKYPSDLTDYINTAPQFYGGFENSFTYKGFQLDFLFQFVKQTGENIFYFLQSPGAQSNLPVDVLNRWQNPGDVKPYEQYTQSFSSNASKGYDAYYESSSAVYSDASFIRLKNLAFSYSLPQEWLTQLHVRSCRVYMNGQNLLTFTKYLGLDPETQGITLPPLRVWSLGIQLGL